MEFLEVPLFDDDIYKLAVRFLLNVFFMVLIVRFAILPGKSNREFAFTAVMMNVTAFFICFSLKKLELELGMALGLFAIFGVLRYRTDAIRTKEMTYLFILLGIAVINALSNRKTSYAEILAINCVIFAVTMLKECMTRSVEAPPETATVPAAKPKAAKKPRAKAAKPDSEDKSGPASKPGRRSGVPQVPRKS